LEGLQGTLKRAMEFFLIRRDRDRLVREKLGALQRMLVMDRVRGLSTLATVLGRSFRNAGPALVNYVRQAKLEKQIAARSEDLLELDIMRASREECEHLIRALQTVLGDVADAAGQPDEQLDLEAMLRAYVDAETPNKAEAGITMQADIDSSLPSVRGNRMLLGRLISILVERISDMDGDDRRIRIHLESAGDDQVRLIVTADSLPWENGKVASLYSALVPFREWPMGLDMDILSAFFIAHHHGGSIELLTSPPGVPGSWLDCRCPRTRPKMEKWTRRGLTKSFGASNFGDHPRGCRQREPH
jgi:hypothetical protein